MIVPTQAPGKSAGTFVDNDVRSHWAIKLKIRIGDTLLTQTTVNAVIDTGATQLFFPPKMCDDYIGHTRAKLNIKCDGYELAEDQFKDLPSLFFIIEDIQGKAHEFEYINDAQIWPKALSEQENVQDDHFILSVARLKKNTYVVLGEPFGEYMLDDNLLYLILDQTIL